LGKQCVTSTDFTCGFREQPVCRTELIDREDPRVHQRTDVERKWCYTRRTRIPFHRTGRCDHCIFGLSELCRRSKEIHLRSFDHHARRIGNDLWRRWCLPICRLETREDARWHIAASLDGDSEVVFEVVPGRPLSRSDSDVCCVAQPSVDAVAPER